MHSSVFFCIVKHNKKCDPSISFCCTLPSESKQAIIFFCMAFTTMSQNVCLDCRPSVPSEVLPLSYVAECVPGPSTVCLITSAPTKSSQVFTDRTHHKCSQPELCHRLCLPCLVSVLIHPHTVRMMFQNICMAGLPSVSPQVLPLRHIFWNIILTDTTTIWSQPPSQNDVAE